LIGFPLLYLEMSIGQFCKAGPAVAYGWIRPAFQVKNKVFLIVNGEKVENALLIFYSLFLVL